MFARGFLSTSLVALSLTGWLAGVAAAGLSTGSSATVLGQPLDFPVQVRLDRGETLTSDCVGAEVHVSDQRLPPSAVRAVIDQQGNSTARIRVQTQQAIDEPVVSITLRVGCTAPITRRFVVFADPPSSLAAAAPAAIVAAPPAVLAVAQADAVQPPAVAVVNPAGEARLAGTAADTVRSSPRATERSNRRPMPAAPRPARPAKPQANQAVAKSVGAAPSVAAAPAPRLTLEPALPPPPTAKVARAEADAVGAALVAVAQAASAAQSAAIAASAWLDRIANLERTVTQLRNDAQASQALVAQLREKLDQAQGGGQWMWPLLLMAMALAGLAAWLAWRLGRLQAVRQVAWVQQLPAVAAVQEAPQRPGVMADGKGRATTGPASFMTDVPTFPPRSGLGSVQKVAGSTVPAPAFAAQGTPSQRPSLPARPPSSGLARDGRELPDITPMDTPMAHTEPMPAPLRRGESNVRDVSIEELIDLEQQAEFFVVLGQDEAAVDLLVDHLRSTGGGSPLPYLKLLEIYSRTGDHDAYERNRARFNHRFNAYAPEWGSDLAQGRSLEDYPGILPRLEQVWPRPLDAMAELEALLFRKSRGELFELPAYREVLFLYALARDLLDREAADTGTVDLLLPLADGTAFGTTAPVPFLHDELRTGDRDFDFDDPPTGPVDFDLTIPAQQTSMFDPMEEPARPRRR